MTRFITIHGHFYQPPRENPWLDAVEVQDSAAPYHDWNERVTAECYAPNTAARRVRADERILDIVNNFEKISFNVGPTLAAWLARRRPDVYAKILEADRRSVAARGGHGNAIAQAYNHVILPLATRRDKVTQVRWGLEDFRARFGRDAEGIWLPETAVDSETLEVLAEAGVRFTILAPHQAWRVRPLGGDRWEEVNERVDPSRPYLWRSPGGAQLAVFFYDGPISRAIAFEDALARGENLVKRLRGGFADGRDGPQLVHCATDGESYGHHRAFGDMALAAALQQVEAEGFATLTNYGAFLAAHPPRAEVQIRERTSWSCAHGVERWRADCGCRTRSDYHQKWRGPLREALDWLREQIDPFYEARASAVLKDPWAARDAYVAVIIGRTESAVERFLAAHQAAPLDAGGRLEARRLLELQTNRLLMYASCGWFFDEISSIEPVQTLRYAAIALQYLRDLGGGDLEADFLHRLAAAPSNVPEYRDGAETYRRLVRPTVVDLNRVVAHYAITGLYEPYPDDASVYAYRVQRADEATERYGGTEIRIAHVRVRSETTGAEADLACAVLHFGGHDFSCGVRAYRDQTDYEAMKEDLLTRYGRASMADLVRGMDQHFPGELFSLKHLFLEERRRVLGSAIRAVLDRQEQTYREIWEENRKLMRHLREVETPVPEALALAARHALEQEAFAELRSVAADGSIPARVFDLAAEAMTLGLKLDLTPARPTMHAALLVALDRLAAAAPSAAAVAQAIALIDGAAVLGVPFGKWATQNRFFELWRARPADRPLLAPLADALGFALALEDRR